MTNQHSCPNCGNTLAPRLQQSKVAGCDACGSTVMLADGQFLAPGAAGEMHEGPTFLKLGVTADFGPESFTPLGLIRYSYGRGWWDEFWCREERSHEGVWISVDEGDLVLERPMPDYLWPALTGAVRIGSTTSFNGKVYTAKEAESAECIAFRGELPEAPALGERHDFVNFTGEGGEALSLEIWPGGRAWHEGRWIDPYEVRIESNAE